VDKTKGNICKKIMIATDGSDNVKTQFLMVLKLQKGLGLKFMQYLLLLFLMSMPRLHERA